MLDFDAFLATLSQSSAAIVAIIGGFLVSRLVAMSSEREGVRRQLNAAQQRLQEYWESHNKAHSYRFERSVQQLEDWILSDVIELVVEQETPDFDDLLIAKENIPRGSSYEEMLPQAEAIVERVTLAASRVAALLRSTDTSQLDFDELRERGLNFSESEANLYDEVFGSIRRQLASPHRSMFDIPNLRHDIGPITPGWIREVDARRLDESIRDEQQAQGMVTATENEIVRLTADLDQLAQPVGVISAVVILAVYSVLGIVFPLTIMGIGLECPPSWLTSVLLGAFILGLGSVLTYIIWYLKRISR